MPRADSPEAAAPIDVSIVIVNWNTLDLTSATIESVREHTRGVSYEIVLVDNGSTRDASATELPRRHPDVTFIASPENLGFAGANNLGIARVRGRYVLLLNSDTLQVENAIGESVAYMDRHAEVGALGVRHLNHDAARSTQPSAFAAPSPWRDIASTLGLERLARRADDERGVTTEADVDWVVGSYLFIRRACLEQVGGLDPRFFLYDEDIDWCRRARTAGWKVRFWPGVSIIHIGNGSRGYMRDKTFLHFRSRLTYMAKAHARPVAGMYYVALGLRLTAATAWQAWRVVTRQSKPQELRERLDRQRRFLMLVAGRQGS